MTERKLLTIKEAAATLSLSPKTLWAWRARRQIGIVQVGRSVRIAQSEIDRILNEGTVPAREQS
jgi:excisionase family DNA binding protein